jgi:hypothetical protein
MTITRLTLHPLLYLDLLADVAGDCHYLAIEDLSAVSYVSWIEMRLLRDTRRVLEHLSERGRGQPSVYDMYETMKRRWALQLPEYISAVEQVFQIKHYRMTRVCTNKLEYIRAQIEYLALCSTRQSRLKRMTQRNHSQGTRQSLLMIRY